MLPGARARAGQAVLTLEAEWRKREVQLAVSSWLRTSKEH